MDFLDFGKPESDDGEWVKIGKQDFEVRVRPLPLEQARRIESRYGKEERVRNLVGRYVFQRLMDEKQTMDCLLDKADWIWTDARGCYVTPKDEAAAQWWSDAIGGTVSVGDRICLDGKLNSKIKRRLLMADPDARLALALLKQEDIVGRHRSAVEEAALSN